MRINDLKATGRLRTSAPDPSVSLQLASSVERVLKAKRRVEVTITQPILLMQHIERQLSQPFLEMQRRIAHMHDQIMGPAVALRQRLADSLSVLRRDFVDPLANVVSNVRVALDEIHRSVNRLITRAYDATRQWEQLLRPLAEFDWENIERQAIFELYDRVVEADDQVDAFAVARKVVSADDFFDLADSEVKLRLRCAIKWVRLDEMRQASARGKLALCSDVPDSPFLENLDLRIDFRA